MRGRPEIVPAACAAEATSPISKAIANLIILLFFEPVVDIE
jgi:hypothetical protein